MLKRVLRRDRDGLFLEWVEDGPSRWVKDPLDATDRPLYENELDVKGSLYNKPGYTLVEFRLSATPTGRTCRDFYKDGVYQETKTSSKRLFVHLGDLQDLAHGPIATFELDVALWDENRYAGEMRAKVLRTAAPTHVRITPTPAPDGGELFPFIGLGDLAFDRHLVQGDMVTLPNGFGISS